MRHLLGIEDAPWRSASQVVSFAYDSAALINGHMLFAGMSGTGKSFQIMRYLESARKAGIEADIFDVHEELHEVPGAAACKFSEATQLGFNPLVPSLDIHSGGIKRQVDLVIDIIGRTSRKLGPRQESALRYLLMEVYTLRGMIPDRPDTWDKRIITESEFDMIVAERRYQDLRQCQPILRDVISLAERKLKALTFGADSRSVTAMEAVERSVARMHNLITKRKKSLDDEEVVKLGEQIQAEKEKAVGFYADFLGSLETGREYVESLRYSNPETLKSLLERLNDLNDSGIFRSNPPAWDDVPMRVYQIGSLTDDNKRMLFYLRAENIMRQAQDMGKTDSVRHILLVDEGHLYYSEDKDNPINRIAKEGRKFGVALVIGSQSPTHFSEDFLSNCGAIVLCGISSLYWDMACRKLMCDKSVLMSTSAKKVAAVKLQRHGEADPRFVNVIVDRTVLGEASRAVERLRRSAPEMHPE